MIILNSHEQNTFDSIRELELIERVEKANGGKNACWIRLIIVSNEFHIGLFS